jgi:hypothetical protein
MTAFTSAYSSWCVPAASRIRVSYRRNRPDAPARRTHAHRRSWLIVAPARRLHASACLFWPRRHRHEVDAVLLAFEAARIARDAPPAETGRGRRDRTNSCGAGPGTHRPRKARSRRRRATRPSTTDQVGLVQRQNNSASFATARVGDARHRSSRPSTTVTDCPDLDRPPTRRRGRDLPSRPSSRPWLAHVSPHRKAGRSSQDGRHRRVAAPAPGILGNPPTARTTVRRPVHRAFAQRETVTPVAPAASPICAIPAPSDQSAHGCLIVETSHQPPDRRRHAARRPAWRRDGQAHR